MKVLILTCNTGEGHNQTSKAIIDEFTSLGCVCVAVDSLKFLSQKKSEFLCNWHQRLYRHLPRTASIGYSIIDRNPKPLEQSGRWLYKFFARGADKLYQLISEEKYDTVISVHPFSAVIIAGFQQKYKDVKVRTAFVATDYTCSPGAASGNIDTYFIPHPDLADAFVKRGVPREKIVSLYGIPVKKEFFNAPTKKEAKEALGLSADTKSVLLTCGSMGCGPILKLSKKLSKALPSSVNLFVICGKNKSLYKKLINKKFPENISIIGYTDKMSYYTASSDLYITKPGGISSTEIAVIGVPALFINAVGGCETYNCNFFVNKGSAKTAKKTDDFIKLTLSALEGDSEFEKASEKIKAEFSQNSAEKIASFYLKSSN
ncbi:MAG: glycosyltransferase [Ruminococcaceae bacterium]|nr:glycosyltransferase [Oscillospiraceae bacterium]